MITGIS